MVPQKFEDFRDRDIEPETSLGGGDAHGYPFYLWRESADNRLTLGRPRYCCITETPDDLYFTFFNPSVDIRPTGAARVFGWGITISAIIMLFLAWRGNGSTGPYVSNTSAPPFMTVVGTFLFATTFGGIASGSWFAIVTLRRWMADRFKGDGRVEMKPLRCLDGFQVISAHEAGAMKNGELAKIGHGLAAVFDDNTQWILTGNAWNYRSVVDDHRRLTEAFRRPRDELVSTWQDQRRKAFRNGAAAKNAASPSPRNTEIPDSL